MKNPVPILAILTASTFIFVPIALFSSSCPGGRCGLRPQTSASVTSAGSISAGTPVSSPAFRTEPAPPHPAVARILVENAQTRNYGTGTWIRLSQNRSAILTCAHLFETDHPERIAVCFPNHSAFSARIQAIDRSWDVALLQTSAGASAFPNAMEQPDSPASSASSVTGSTSFPQPVFVAQAPPVPGDYLRVCGYGPDGQSLWILGTVRGYCRLAQVSGAHTLVMTGNARHGDSGAPIFTLDGTLAGVLWGTDGQSLYGTWSGQIRTVFWTAFQETASSEASLPEGESLQQEDAFPDSGSSPAASERRIPRAPNSGNERKIAKVPLIPRRNPSAAPRRPFRANPETPAPNETPSDSRRQPATLPRPRLPEFPGLAKEKIQSGWWHFLPFRFPFGLLAVYLIAWLIPIVAVLAAIRKRRNSN